MTATPRTASAASQPQPAEPDRIGVTEATDRLCRRGVPVDRSTVRRWCKTGSLPAKRVGSRYYIQQADVDRMADG